MIEVIAGIFAASGIIIAFVGGILLLIEAFKESFFWGLGCFLFPIVSLVFLVSHWDVARKPFFVELGGCSVIILGMLVGLLK